MASLKLVNSGNIHYYEFRDSLYYNNFKYKAKIELPGIKFLYHSDTISSWKYKIQNLSRSNLYFLSRYFGNNDETTLISKILENEEAITKYIAYYKKYNKELTFRQEGHSVSIFSNNLSDFDDLLILGVNLKVLIFEAKVTLFSGVKLFVNKPKYKFRVYLKNKMITEEEKNNLVSFVKTKNYIKTGPSFSDWIYSTKNMRRFYISSNFYIDYNDEVLGTLIGLTFSDLLGKHYRLEQISEENLQQIKIEE